VVLFPLSRWIVGSVRFHSNDDRLVLGKLDLRVSQPCRSYSASVTTSQDGSEARRIDDARRWQNFTYQTRVFKGFTLYAIASLLNSRRSEFAELSSPVGNLWYEARWGVDQEMLDSSMRRRASYRAYCQHSGCLHVPRACVGETVVVKALALSAVRLGSLSRCRSGLKCSTHANHAEPRSKLLQVLALLGKQARRGPVVLRQTASWRGSSSKKARCTALQFKSSSPR